MPAAHLPTPANLPNLNAKSAGAPPVRWRRERDGERGGARTRRRTGKVNIEDTRDRKIDIGTRGERTSERKGGGRRERVAGRERDRERERCGEEARAEETEMEAKSSSENGIYR